MTCEFFSDGLADREAQLLEEANAKHRLISCLKLIHFHKIY